MKHLAPMTTTQPPLTSVPGVFFQTKMETLDNATNVKDFI